MTYTTKPLIIVANGATKNTFAFTVPANSDKSFDELLACDFRVTLQMKSTPGAPLALDDRIMARMPGEDCTLTLSDLLRDDIADQGLFNDGPGALFDDAPGLDQALDGPDFDAVFTGVFWVLIPCTDFARDWIEENLIDCKQYDGAARVERGYMDEITASIRDTGLEIHLMGA